MCRGLKLVKTPAKKIPDKSGQREINQSEHTQVLADLPPALVFDVADTGANRKRMIFFVKHVRSSPADMHQQWSATVELCRSKEITMSLFR
jgi:hypothetical protein